MAIFRSTAEAPMLHSAAAMDRKNSIQELVRHEEAFSKGEQIALSLRSEGQSAQAVMAHFLRAFKGRQDFADVVIPSAERGEDLAERLEKIRNSLYCGDTDAAESMILPVLSEDAYGEFALELARVRLFQSRLVEALSAVDRALQLTALGDASRMTCHQLRGDILIRLGRTREGIEDIKKAIALAEVFNLASSAFSAHAFLVKAYVELGDPESARSALRVLKSQLESPECIKSDELWLDRLLTVIRTEVHLYKESEVASRGTQPWHVALAEAHAIAQHLGDQLTIRRCESEAGSEVKFELLAIDGRRVVNSFNGWRYLPFRELALISSPRGVLRLDSRPVMQKVLLELISSPNGLDKHLLFERAYNIRFDSERHSAHLLATLSKFRKLLPPGALQLSDGKVRLV
jgi:tetratricopeptide (TPR) repeat protein